MGGDLGKLKAAAVWLVTPADEAAGIEHDRQAEQSLRDLGVSEEDIELARQAERASNAEQAGPDLWAWHLDAMRLFDAMRSQWRAVAGMGGVMYLGLDYGPRRDVMRTIGLRDSAELFEQFQVMERAARDELNRQVAKG